MPSAKFHQFFGDEGGGGGGGHIVSNSISGTDLGGFFSIFSIFKRSFPFLFFS